MTSTTTQPSEIAREALRRLAMRRIQPTPDNYRALYHEIAGIAHTDAFPDRAMKAVASSLPRATPEQLKFARQIDAAIVDRNWAMFKIALVTLVDERNVTTRTWSLLIRELLTQLERRHSGLTPTKKRDALDHVLESCSSDADQLYARLHSLLRAWSQTPQASAESRAAKHGEMADAPQASATGATPAQPDSITDLDTASELRELLAQVLENGIGALLVEAPDTTQEITVLAADIRAARSQVSLEAVTARLKQFAYNLQWVTEDQAELKAALLRLINLLMENIGELIVEDNWLHGQIAMIMEQVSGALNVRRLDEVERRLKDIIHTQSALKKNLSDARDRIKTMLAGFVEHLTGFTESTGDYHAKIETCAERISTANDISELTDVIDQVMRETHAIQTRVEHSRNEMQEMKSRVEDADREISRLQQALVQTSEMVRQDHLTGALNRKGMQETLDRELSRSRRRNSPLCVALLDIDNFKRLNDTYGHQTGDDALVHLANVVCGTLRPHDTLARYGGEEFLIMLPDTGLHDAVTALARLQRDLTKKFFLHNNEKLLITFSAGVAQFKDDEARDDAIGRVDAAMYQAKRSGKNRVVAAD